MDCSCIVSVPRYDMTGWQISRAEQLTSSSVSRWNGQNISSSSMSNERAASKSRLKAMDVGGSTLNSLGVRTWLLLMLGRDPWRAPRSAAVVVVVAVLVGGEVLGVVLCTVVEELRHGGFVLMADRMESVRGCAKGR